MRRRIQILSLVFGCSLMSNGLHAQVNSDSASAVCAEKANMYLDKAGKVSDAFSFTQKGIEVFAPATDSTPKRREFTLLWDDAKSFCKMIDAVDSRTIYDYYVAKEMKDAARIKLTEEQLDKKMRKALEDTPGTWGKPLERVRIAIDPGHIAGDMETAKMEKKWVDMKNPDVELVEGELTLATARILKKKLEVQGATVMITRERPNISAFGVDFVKWTDSLFVSSIEAAYKREDVTFEEKNYLLTKARNIEIFRRFFLTEDLRERARRINEFDPDITLVIHYNADETNINWNKPSKKNYNMAFVGGSFAEDELNSPESRMEFLRLLLTDDIERSIEFSKFITESLVKKTGVPAALDSSAIYLKDNCMKTGIPGVFCRNLTLTRKVKGVICYGESLYQDNVNECRALSKKEVKIDGMETSKRVEQVAEAYYLGILSYIENRKIK